MIKDIPQLIVEDIAVAAIKEINEQLEEEWNVYFINMKDEAVDAVLVTSTGYGELNGEKVQTSTLRHFLDRVEAKSYTKIEPIMENVFALNNEYWVSFYLNKQIYDKKYIFLAETIKDEYFTHIPIIDKVGVMIK